MIDRPFTSEIRDDRNGDISSNTNADHGLHLPASSQSRNADHDLHLPANQLSCDDDEPQGGNSAGDFHPNDPDAPNQPPPRGAPQPPPSPPPDRSELTVEAWRRRELPPRDYLLDGVMCTTSRWIIIGDTGVGKTLLGLELGFAVAAAMPFLIWKGVRKSRVMYFDGE